VPDVSTITKLGRETGRAMAAAQPSPCRNDGFHSLWHARAVMRRSSG